jgi:cytidine deaminase
MLPDDPWSTLSEAEQLQWRQRLLEEAEEACANAYSPFSRIRVGAALLLNDLRIVRGANVENSSYGLTVCGERVAVFTAVAQGYRSGDFAGIAVVAYDIAGSPRDAVPCGACLQVLAEFAGDPASFFVLVKQAEGVVRKFSLADLLPFVFRL